MTGDFNIRDSDWGPDYLFHSVHSELLFDISDALDLFFLILLTLSPPGTWITMII